MRSSAVLCMLHESPRADRPAPAPLQVPAVKPDLPTTTAESATTPGRAWMPGRNGPMDAAKRPILRIG
jgi:hypothetical protein